VLTGLFENLTSSEREYLVSLVIGEAQQGAGEGIIKIAIARFFNVSTNDIDQAYLYNPDLGSLFMYLLNKGGNAIKKIAIRIFRPVKPMLAQVSESIDDIMLEYGDVVVEQKLDGVRIQVHKHHASVKIFSRNLKDITQHFPEIVSMAKSLPTDTFILDGEAIGVGKNGRVVPFQVLAQRTTRKKEIEKMMKKIPVVPKFFDVLYRNKEDITQHPYVERSKILKDIVKTEDYIATHCVSKTSGDANAFFINEVQKGNEGIVVKLVDSPYSPGRRGKNWFKIKKTYTVDCVVLAAEWGYGRREGWLSNLHLGVLDETKTKYLMVGKTFKGLTDQMLRWFTDTLPKYKVHETKWTMYVKPHVVVEIAFNEVQKSHRYDSGVALRFARVKKIRDDKKPDEVNTILDLESIQKFL
jgi:DNA ligase-1